MKWLGCCPECKEWETFIEIKSREIKQIGKTNFGAATATTLTHLSHIASQSQPRLLSGIAEWDRVVGGGIDRKSVV